MSRRFFGTDGIRGSVGKAPITPDFMLRLGWASGVVFSRQNASTGRGRPTVLIGKDTRVSGYMFESALEAGLVAAGVDVKLLGPMPTPAVAMMTRSHNAAAGIVISASHNPFDDNGIKFFSAEGAKLLDEVELEIEAQLDKEIETVGSREIGKAVRVVDAAGRYIEFCKSTVPEGFSLAGLKLCVDCAHGATYHIAPSVFSELGAEVIPMGVQPDGFNINDEVGSTSTAQLAELVRREGADMGIAFDGDGDRVLFIDGSGNLVDGDQLLYLIAMHHLAIGTSDAGVVGTQMTNLGLELALQEQGLELRRAKVGDRYVKEMMEALDWHLGGESSGHIICADVTTTGDGIVAALQALRAVKELGGNIEAALKGMVMLPQVMINVAVTEKVRLEEFPQINDAVQDVESDLGRRGRVLLRPSGTEPVVRVMVEGEDHDEVARHAGFLAERVQQIIAAEA